MTQGLVSASKAHLITMPYTCARMAANSFAFIWCHMLHVSRPVRSFYENSLILSILCACKYMYFVEGRINAKLYYTGSKNSAEPHASGVYCTIAKKFVGNVNLEMIPCATLFDCELQQWAWEVG